MTAEREIVRTKPMGKIRMTATALVAIALPVCAETARIDCVRLTATNVYEEVVTGWTTNCWPFVIDYSEDIDIRQEMLKRSNRSDAAIAIPFDMGKSNSVKYRPQKGEKPSK